MKKKKNYFYRGNDSKSVTIQDPEQGNIIINISGQTIMTIIYQ